MEDSTLDSSSLSVDSSDDSDQETTPVIDSVDTVDGAQGGDIYPPGEEMEINTVVAERKRVIDRLLDKFKEICPRVKLGRTRQFLKQKKDSKVTRHQMAEWKVKFRCLIRHQEDIIRNDRSPTTEAKAAYDTLLLCWRKCIQHRPIRLIILWQILKMLGKNMLCGRKRLRGHKWSSRQVPDL